MKLWLKIGVMAGLAGVIFMLANAYFLQFGIGIQFLAAIIISIVFSIMVNREYRNENPDSDHGYGQTFKLSFLTLYTGSILSSLIIFIVVMFIDPSLYDTFMQFGMDFSRSIMETMGMPEDQIEEAMIIAEEQANSTEYGVSSLLVSCGQSLGMDILFAAVISIFLKKKSKDNF